MAPPDDVLSEIQRLFAKRGEQEYLGEAVTQLEHALQCAQLAQEAQADNFLVAAALLHDVGHLLYVEKTASHAPKGEDDFHENVGYHWAKARFRSVVSDCIRLHVPAKRYLCTVDDRYFGLLSSASVESLRLQGGPMSAEETSAFESEQYFREAVQVRRWDDEAKVVGKSTPPLEHFHGAIRAALR